MISKRITMSRRAPGSAPRFTLIEVLVVVAVVSILAAMLAPALRKALDNAKDLTCLNNLRQIGVAAITYVGDNHGRMPAAWQSGPQWRWQDLLAAYGGVASGPVTKECFVETYKVGSKEVKRGKGIFSCPGTTNDWVVKKDATDAGVNYLTCLTLDYGMNTHLSGTRLVRVRQMAKTFAFMDRSAPPGSGTNKSASAHLYGSNNDCWGNYWPMFDFAAPRHRNKLYANIVYTDGHCATHLMPVLVNWKFIGGGDIPKNCTQQNFKAGVWWHDHTSP